MQTTLQNAEGYNVLMMERFLIAICRTQPIGVNPGRWNLKPSSVRFFKSLKHERKIIFYNTLHNQVLSGKWSVKYPSLIMLNALCWKQKIICWCPKATAKLTITKINILHNPRQFKIMDFQTVIYPLLEFYSLVWDPSED